MKTVRGPTNRVLEVDLTVGTHQVFTVSEDDRRRFLGGKGLGLKLVADRQPAGADPLGPDNRIAFMPGVLMGTGAPCSGRFSAVTRSPLTGLFASSSCGGPFGMALKTAGWDGLVLAGRAAAPTVVRVTPEGVRLEDATDLWGLDTVATRAHLGEGGGRGCLVIGPAGERRVRFANIASGHRFLGRGGMGAVLGAKNVKAVVVEGGAYRIVPARPEAFARVRKRATAYLKRMEVTGRSYPKYGTAANLAITDAARILPVHNFQQGSHPDALRLSGERIAADHHTRPHTCKPCSILCGHVGTFGGETLPVPEYETLGLLGSNLGVFDPVTVAHWNRVCGELGLDTISAGGVLGWVMEAAQRGLVESPLRFDAPAGVEAALGAIAAREGFGDEMAEGVRFLAGRYGGEAFAIHVKGLEVAAYDPRGAVGHGLAYAVANRGGCHLSAFVAGLEVFFGLLDPATPRAKPEATVFFENLTAAVNSLATCLFTSYAYLMEPPLSRFTPRPVLGALMQYLPRVAFALTDTGVYRDLWSSTTGLDLGRDGLMKAGARIHLLERHLNAREGVRRADDTLPPRFLHEGRADDPAGRVVPLGPMVDRYYRLRGYDPDGVPTPATLRRHGLA